MAPAQPDAIAIPTPEEIRARAERNALTRLARDTSEWRGRAGTALKLLGVAALGALPALPGGRELTGVHWHLSALVFGLYGAASVAASIAYRGDPANVAYARCTWVSAVCLALGTALLIGAAGTARTVYWLDFIYAGVIATHSIVRLRRYINIIGVGTSLTVVALLVRGAMTDAAFAAVIALSIQLIMNVAARSRRAAEEVNARGELLAERAGRALVEHERARIARELHDGLGAELSAALLHAEALGIEGSSASAKLQESVRAGVAELRAVLTSVDREAASPRQLGEEVGRVLRAIAGERAEVDVRVATPLGPRVPGSVTSNVLRVAQEFAHNALVHGRATCLTGVVELLSGPGTSATLQVTLTDDGRGRVAGLSPARGMGNVRARAEALGGQVQWSDAPERGIRCVLRVPVGVEERPSLAAQRTS
ncbi:MAG: histidine kinase [Polyangiales bacterium]